MINPASDLAALVLLPASPSARLPPATQFPAARNAPPLTLLHQTPLQRECGVLHEPACRPEQRHCRCEKIHRVAFQRVTKTQDRFGIAGNHDFAREKQGIAIQPALQQTDERLKLSFDTGVEGLIERSCRYERGKTAAVAKHEAVRKVDRLDADRAGRMRRQRAKEPWMFACKHGQQQTDSAFQNRGWKQCQRVADKQNREFRFGHKALLLPSWCFAPACLTESSSRSDALAQHGGRYSALI